MDIPVTLKTSATELPRLAKGEMRFLAAKNGMFRECRQSAFAASTRLDKNQMQLEDHDEYCILTCGRIPLAMHRAMLAFFRRAHELHGGEAALQLLYHADQRRFRWQCPEQFVDVNWSHGRWLAADYIQFTNPVELPAGYIHFGDAHLHPGAANPSYLDIAEEQDGLHIIVGDILRRPTYNIGFVMDSTRFAVAPHLMFKDLDVEPFDHVPRGWLQKIQLQHRDWLSPKKNLK